MTQLYIYFSGDCYKLNSYTIVDLYILRQSGYDTQDSYPLLF